MTCPKCSGLMIPERAYDGSYTLACLRCANCGKITFLSEDLPKPVVPISHTEKQAV